MVGDEIACRYECDNDDVCGLCGGGGYPREWYESEAGGTIGIDTGSGATTGAEGIP